MTPSKPVTCRNAIIGGTRSHAKTLNFGSSNPTSTAIVISQEIGNLNLRTDLQGQGFLLSCGWYSMCCGRGAR